MNPAGNSAGSEFPSGSATYRSLTRRWPASSRRARAAQAARDCLSFFGHRLRRPAVDRFSRDLVAMGAALHPRADCDQHVPRMTLSPGSVTCQRRRHERHRDHHRPTCRERLCVRVRPGQRTGVIREHLLDRVGDDHDGNAPSKPQGPRESAADPHPTLNFTAPPPTNPRPDDLLGDVLAGVSRSGAEPVQGLWRPSAAKSRCLSSGSSPVTGGESVLHLAVATWDGSVTERGCGDGDGRGRTRPASWSQRSASSPMRTHR